jgi:multisubunit Na+/H+ antiporter MnhF subunit
MGVQILLRQINLGSFLMVGARMIILAVLVPVATLSPMVIRILDSPSTSTRLIGYYSLT